MTTRARRCWSLVAVGSLVLAGLAGPPRARASEALWALLREGGHVVLLRHSPTDPGAGDPPGFRLEDCATQRNLSEAGRAQARRLGEAFRARAVPVGEVLSSSWCRCLETGRLAFGRAQPWPALDSQFQDRSRAAEQGRAVREHAGRRPGSGNLVMISHGTNIAAWTGVYPAQGEMVILTPRGDGGFAVAGKLAVD
jgi:phosphohistidine phosphatase SixA